MRHPARRCCKSATCQHLHEPLSQALALTGRGEAFRAHIVNYADDFVILSQDPRTRPWLDKGGNDELGLTLNEAKTSVKDARTERFDFLGYTFGPHCYQRNGTGIWRKSIGEKCQACQDEGQRRVGAGQHRAMAEVCDRLNSLLRGWSAYFGYGTRGGHTRPSIITSADASDTSSVGGTRCPTAEHDGFPSDLIFGGLGVLALDYRRGPHNEPVGKPDAGNPHVRFDERGRETGRRRTASHRALPARRAKNGKPPRTGPALRWLRTTARQAPRELCRRQSGVAVEQLQNFVAAHIGDFEQRLVDLGFAILGERCFVSGINGTRRSTGIWGPAPFVRPSAASD